MFRRVTNLFHGRSAGGSLLVALCLLTVAALLGAPSSAAAAAYGDIATVYWIKGNDSGYEIQATVTTTSLAESVTLSGPNISPTELLPVAGGEGMKFKGTAVFNPSTASPVPTTNTAYSMLVTYGVGGTPETVTAATTAIPVRANVPGLTTPLGGIASTATPTLYWTAPTTQLAKFIAYGVSLFDTPIEGDPLQWNTDALSGQTSVLYGGSALTVGTPYQWSVAAVDSNGNRAENRGGYFVIGANFSGKVTDLAQQPLPGIAVQAATLAGVDVGTPVYTNADGSYIYAGLPPGQYQIHFDNIAYYWQNKLNPYLEIGGKKDLASADVLTVTAGAVTKEVNARIRGWGALVGFVSVSSGFVPADGVQVTVCNLSDVPVTSIPVVSVALNSSGYGEFYVPLIPPGSYKLKFSAVGYAPKYKPFTIVANQVLVGESAVWEMLTTTAQIPFTAATEGAGTGTVSGAGISCTTGSTLNCSSSYNPGSVVTLSATSSAGSVFGGWSGACTGTNANCQVTIDKVKSVTALFNTKPATVKNDVSGALYFSIAAALDDLINVSAPQRILAKSTELFVEQVIMETGGDVKFKGGYTNTDALFTDQTGRTIIDGSLKIRKGKFIAERLAIR